MSTDRKATHSPRRLMRSVALLFAGTLPLMWAAGVSAQVIRCTDPTTGKVSYTDGKCASGTNALEIEAKKSPEEIKAEREQAAQAQERTRERLQQDAKRRQENTDLQRREQELRARTQTTESENPANSQACTQARRNLEDVQASMGQGMYDESTRLSEAQRNAERACLTPDQWVRAQRDAQNNTNHNYYQTYPYVVRPPHVVRPPVRPQPEPKPPVFTNCNVFRCTDAQGNVYPR